MKFANYLTIARMFMVPIFMYLFSIQQVFAALIVFAFASLTDFFDGIVARWEGPTGFGGFMDPLADKLLVCAALISFTRAGEGLIAGWMVMVIIGREFIITGLRVVLAASNGRVVEATKWGKAKTVSQMTVISLGLLLLTLHDNRSSLGMDWSFMSRIRDRHGPIYFMMYLPLVLTVVSGLEFIYNNRRPLWNLLTMNQFQQMDD
ncbi:TPA: CDP-diacylglycerol--glycerol-3-phosphate 3-phosphatidyltransferase [Candidatus Poribacteria bacterium]|nr:CDP-diacylglycerol--glycerol-3-phosphate 3-phosphatidyltransferase [Candidatus Poribacteria bacterium]